MACVARETTKYPLEVYRFFKEQGVQFIQFTPIVERQPSVKACSLGLKLDLPPDLKNNVCDKDSAVTAWTVEPEALGNFYNTIFDEWVRHDVGKVFVMNFEWALFNSMGGDGAVCYMSKRCGNAMIVEHNGDIYSCDHFVYPEFKLGNVLYDNVRMLLESRRQLEWGCRKEKALPSNCKTCAVAFICRGGCPKHRFNATEFGEPGYNYLCVGYKNFYQHIAKYMRGFHALLEHGMPCEAIMQAIDKPLVFISKTTQQQVVLWVK